MDLLILNLTNGDKKDLLKKEEDILYQLTTSGNQNNNEYKNISSIILGECEKILKKEYNINENENLLIFKIDYYKANSLIPIIGYEIFHPITKEQLNLTICKDKIINFNIPVFIDEDNLFQYDPNNEYYTDECIPYTTENGTDILINDRHDEYNNKNISLCENNCKFKEYEINTKKSICECEIKSKQIVISEVINQTDILFYNFTNKKESSNMVTLKCYYTLFTKNGLYKNIGNYIIAFITILFAILGILFYKCGYYYFENEITLIIKEKTQKESNYSMNIIETNVDNKKKRKGKSLKLKNKNKNKKIKIKGLNKKNKQINLKINGNKDSNTIIKLKKDNSLNLEIKNDPKINYNDYELNNFSYNEALKYDNRTFIKYYISLIRTKHPLIFSFFPINSYNSILIRITLFFISFSIYYFINAIFFNESTIHKIYEEKGKYNFIYLLPHISLSFLISHILSSIIKYIFLSERNICQLKKEKNADKAIDKQDNILRCLKIKYICFFVLGFIFLLFLWYYLSSFGAVYQNSQLYLFRNTIISFALSFIYPFIINLLPGIFRIFSLKKNYRKYMYNISKIIQLI